MTSETCLSAEPKATIAVIMADPTEPVISVAKQAAELVKEVKSLAEGGDEKAPGARGGPLQIVGRLYIALTTIVALSASVSGYLDTKDSATRFNYSVYSDITESTVELRGAVEFAVKLGLIASVILILRLAWKHPMYLSSPTEFSSEVHRDMIAKSEPEGGSKTSDDDASPGAKKRVRRKRGAGS
jgi:hypothetical protein